MNVVKTMCRPFLKRLAQKTLVRRNRCRNSPEKGRFTVADLVVSKNSIFPTQNRIQKWFDVTLAPLLAASADAMLAQCAWYLIPFHCC